MFSSAELFVFHKKENHSWNISKAKRQISSLQYRKSSQFALRRGTFDRDGQESDIKPNNEHYVTMLSLKKLSTRFHSSSPKTIISNGLFQMKFQKTGWYSYFFHFIDFTFYDLCGKWKAFGVETLLGICTEHMSAGSAASQLASQASGLPQTKTLSDPNTECGRRLS